MILLSNAGVQFLCLLFTELYSPESGSKSEMPVVEESVMVRSTSLSNTAARPRSPSPTGMTLSSALRRASGGMTIEQATSFCEDAIPKYCVATNCPKYCDSIRSPKQKISCKDECKLDKRCQLKPVVGNDDPKNMALDAQNRDQLWACIAEKRDPRATTTGRRETPWQQIQTDSFKKAIAATG